MYIEPYETSRYRVLIERAKQAARNAYCPYSNFHVGAALLDKDGSIHTGCNVENSSYGASICAERTAAVKAVSEGCRTFTAVAVVGFHRNEEDMTFCMPCGICRQFLSEFTQTGDFDIAVTDNTNIRIYKCSELLPEAFR